MPCDNLYDYDFLYYADDSGDHKESKVEGVRKKLKFRLVLSVYAADT